MPELPEVETIRRDLENELRGDRVVSLRVFDRRLLSSAQERLWTSYLVGRAWTGFLRKGKYLGVDLANGWRAVFHLRMTGQLVLGIGVLPDATKPRLRLVFESGRSLSFCDQRRFGEAWLLPPGGSWPSKHPLGPDALTELNAAQFARLVKARTTRIHALLLDQRLLCGVGNIYAQEALFKALIRPSRPGRRISRVESDRLYAALRDTLQSAIFRRGSTSRNYRDAYGRAGSAQVAHTVYRRGGQPCLRCRHLLRVLRVGGRGSVFCPQCQR